MLASRYQLSVAYYAGDMGRFDGKNVEPNCH